MIRVSDEVRARIMRCVPDAGSGDVVSVHEIKTQLALSSGTVARVLLEAERSGLVERVRVGAYRMKAKRGEGE